MAIDGADQVDRRLNLIKGGSGAPELQLALIPGAVETGLFVGSTGALVVGTPQGIDIQAARRNREPL